ncbi:MAG: APC family permease [Bdellovibrionota bacterium]
MSKLNKSFGLFALFIYGLGDILGAGIYALVGKVSGHSGVYVWISFAVAMAIAALTAMAYAELASRFPKSGGVSNFANEAFGNKTITFTVGWLLLFCSIVSMATLTRAFSGYVHQFNDGIPHILIAGLFLLALTAINWRGIEHTSRANILATTIEVAGLALVIYAAIYFITSGQSPAATAQASAAAADPAIDIGAIFQGAALAFYAFIGFEDVANVAEETKDPKKHMPIAILGALAVAGTIYILIGWLATQVVSPETLAASSGALTEVVRASGSGVPVGIFKVIALFAIANTCLLNFITSSRLLYGMSEEGVVPKLFGRVHEKFKTPTWAIVFVLPIALVLAVIGDLAFLASTTSVLILVVFCATNISLFAIKRRKEAWDGFSVPAAIPVLALVANVVLISFAKTASLLTALGIAFVGLLLYWLFIKSSGRTKLDVAASRP